MSYADKLFKKTAIEILYSGTSTEEENVRAKWEDGTPAYTKKLFGVINEYDLRKEFPLITYRPTNFINAVKEILWIYQKKSNNIKDLGLHIWDQWADENGTIGKAYGYQAGQPFAQKINNEMVMMDQVDSVLYDLKNNPFSRRIMTNLYNFNDLHEMALYPCAYSCTFNVTKEVYDKDLKEDFPDLFPDPDPLTLNMILNQRSSDFLVANNWNVAQYAALLMMIAQVSNMIPGRLIHVISDCHIYDRHIKIVEDLIKRDSYPAPKVTLDKSITNFYDFTPDSFKVENYETGPQIKNIEVAI